MVRTNNPIIKQKAGLLNLSEELDNVLKYFKIIGLSSDTFYRYQELVEEGGIDALVNQNRRVLNLKNRADEATELNALLLSMPLSSRLMASTGRVMNCVTKRLYLRQAAFAPSGNDMTWRTFVNG